MLLDFNSKFAFGFLQGVFARRVPGVTDESSVGIEAMVGDAPVYTRVSVTLLCV